MALDTKYRPTRYDEVMGQDATVAVLRQFVQSGAGFHQSYLFCGPHGDGKTTLGRILARSLLCESPINGEPCDKCLSCRSILEKGSSECFTEMDAATKSGKDNITRLTEELEYSTSSGTHRLYLFDEAHRLSKQALDALLKPMEDIVHGTDDKQLVCIFCTTEPDKMRNTVFSRCAPAFSIRVVSPDALADRLTWICQQENITFDREALVVISEAVECHIRDAIKAIEGVSMLGDLTRENVNRYLRLDVNDSILRVLAYIGSDLGAAMGQVEGICSMVSPTTAYERLANAALLAYKVHLGVARAPTYWNPSFMAKLGELHKDFLIVFANTFASRPGRPTPSMLALDVAQLHQVRSGVGPVTPTAPPVVVPTTPAPSTPPPVTQGAPEVPANGTSTPSDETPTPSAGNVEGALPQEGGEAPPVVSENKAYETASGVYVDPRAVKKPGQRRQVAMGNPGLPIHRFREALGERVQELRSDGRGRESRQQGQPELGSA